MGLHCVGCRNKILGACGIGHIFLQFPLRAIDLVIYLIWRNNYRPKDFLYRCKNKANWRVQWSAHGVENVLLLSVVQFLSTHFFATRVPHLGPYSDWLRDVTWYQSKPLSHHWKVLIITSKVLLGSLVGALDGITTVPPSECYKRKTSKHIDNILWTCL